MINLPRLSQKSRNYSIDLSALFRNTAATEDRGAGFAGLRKIRIGPGLAP